MTEILIKLTEAEQDVLLNHAAHYPPPGPWASVAGKIRRAREDELWGHDPEAEQGTTFERES